MLYKFFLPYILIDSTYVTYGAGLFQYIYLPSTYLEYIAILRTYLLFILRAQLKLYTLFFQKFIVDSIRFEINEELLANEECQQNLGKKLQRNFQQLTTQTFQVLALINLNDLSLIQQPFLAFWPSRGGQDSVG